MDVNMTEAFLNSKEFTILAEAENELIYLEEPSIESVLGFFKSNFEKIGRQTFFRLIISMCLTRSNKLEMYFNLVEKIAKEKNSDLLMNFVYFVFSYFTQYQFLSFDYQYFQRIFELFVEKGLITEEYLSNYEIPSRCFDKRENELKDALTNDDIAKLQEIYTADINFNLNGKKFNLDYFKCDKPQTLLENAAYYGASKCFNYLLLNNSKMTPKIMQFAVYGGNIDIIRKCDEYRKSISLVNNDPNQKVFESTLETAALKHNNDVFEWLIETGDVSPTVTFQFVNDLIAGCSFNVIKILADHFISLKNDNQNKSKKHNENEIPNDIMNFLFLYDSKFVLPNPVSSNDIIGFLSLYGNIPLLKFLLNNYPKQLIFQAVYKIVLIFFGAIKVFAKEGENFVLEEDMEYWKSIINHKDFDTKAGYKYELNSVFLKKIQKIINNRSFYIYYKYYGWDTEGNQEKMEELTIVFFSIRFLPLDIVQSILNNDEIDINALGPNGKTVLVEALENRRLDIAEFLFNKPDYDYEKDLCFFIYIRIVFSF